MSYDKDSEQPFEEWMEEGKERRIESKMDRSCEGSGTLEEYRSKETFNEVSILSKLKIEDNEDFFLTGSRAWSMEKPESDYDFICDKTTYERLIQRLKKYDLKYIEHDHFSSLYTAGVDGLFNVIGLDEYELKSWKFATKTIEGMLITKAIQVEFFEDKNKVYGLFGIMKGLQRLVK